MVRKRVISTAIPGASSYECVGRGLGLGDLHDQGDREGDVHAPVHTPSG